MIRRLSMLAGLVAVVALMAGCSVGSKTLGTVGGCSPCGYGHQMKTYARSWARAAQNQQEFIDTYFLLYDVHDPYRCDCPIYDYCDSCGPSWGSNDYCSGCSSCR